ncbi:MAG TPA: hypothetical protein VGO61_19385 [Steroidobacteraceae bacterium]|jgi:hypothetical protein|nr:hypothetical protein [Steroidobacteraceae bacterium]
MLTLAVLLQIAGLIFTFSLGIAGYVIGPLTLLAGGLLYRHEQRRRKAAAANPPVQSQPLPPRRPGWQRFLIGLTAVVVAFAGLFALIWQLTSGLAQTADQFFLALRAQDFVTAKTYLAEDFRAATSEQELRDFVSRSALGNYASASWSSRSIENSTGTLEGVVETSTGGSIPMSISLVREHGDWKIYTLRKMDAGIKSLQSAATPSVAEQMRLVRATTHDFADAVARKDFTAFHAKTAALWQKQITPADLQKAMQSFVDSGEDFRRLDDLQPVIESAGIDGDGALVIEGSYPTTPNAFKFRHRYLYEVLDWKLISIRSNIG